MFDYNILMEQENTKDKIKKVAAKLFAELGYDGTTTRDICKAANINISLISYHFGGKEKLYDEIILDAIESQNNFVDSCKEITLNFDNLIFEELIMVLKLFVNRLIDYIYFEVKKESLIIFLRGHKDLRKKYISPVDKLLRELISKIMQKETDDYDVAYSLTFLMSQIVFLFLLDNSVLYFSGNDTNKSIAVEKIKKQINSYIDLFFSKDKLGLV